tara:strand:+ start:5046 stop:5750 length:705 start_codon:yes stop_codon:yes gene_type:complete
MEAVILAAGLGSRLKPFTNDIPKAMVSFKGVEIIKHQIQTLLSTNIEKITIVSGYKSNKLNDFISDNFLNENIKILENKLFSKTNSAFSAMEALENFKTDYLHLNCDILFSKKTLEKIINSPKKNIIAARKDLSLRDSMENIIEINGRIVNMSLKNSPQAKFKAFGLAKISIDALKENIRSYKKLKKEVQDKENYFGLIRMSLGDIQYHLLECDEVNLSEINTVDDLKNCKFNI